MSIRVPVPSRRASTPRAEAHLCSDVPWHSVGHRIGAQEVFFGWRMENHLAVH